MVLTLAAAALIAAPAQASTVTITAPWGKYPWLEYRAAAGEANNLFMRVTTTIVGGSTGEFDFGDSEALFTDTGAVMAGLDRANGLTTCAAVALGGVCVFDGLEGVAVSLGDGNDRADIHHPENLYGRFFVHCGPGIDSVRLLGSNMYPNGDCETVTRT